MLKIKVKRGECNISMRGDFAEIVAETLVAINNIYRGIERDDVAVADAFKHYICRAINDPECTPFASRDDETE